MGMSKKKTSKLKAKGKARRKNVGEMSTLETSVELLNLEKPTSSQFSSSDQRLQEQDRKGLLLTAETLKIELEGLQILNEKLCGDGVEALSFAELKSLRTQLQKAFNISGDQAAKLKVELEERERDMVKNLGEEEGKRLIRSYENEAYDEQFKLKKTRRDQRKQARELRISSDPSKHFDSFETLVEAIEDMKCEVSRLQLYNKRMCGEEIDSLDLFELMTLRIEIGDGLVNVGNVIYKRTSTRR